MKKITGDELPDFYNILLERPKDDPDGYDVLFVDAAAKVGGWGQRPLGGLTRAQLGWGSLRVHLRARRGSLSAGAPGQPTCLAGTAAAGPATEPWPRLPSPATPQGAFASRMSHSCTPNCQAIIMACGGRLTIALYTLRHVHEGAARLWGRWGRREGTGGRRARDSWSHVRRARPACWHAGNHATLAPEHHRWWANQPLAAACAPAGEELTFDYSSVTESEKEFRDAICLCSTRNCRWAAGPLCTAGGKRGRPGMRVRRRYSKEGARRDHSRHRALA